MFVFFHSISFMITTMILLQNYCRRFSCCSAFQLLVGRHYYYQQQRAAVITTHKRLSSLTTRQQKREHPNLREKKTNIFETKQDRVRGSEEDTIFALSSGGGGATAVAVIRLSGSKSFTILDQLMSRNQKRPNMRYAAVRNLYDPRDGSTLDQAIVIMFQQPHSFTGDDVVEIHCHGSRAVIQGILDALADIARPAERGEFTQRAFEHGKLNLLQIEALADLIISDTSFQKKQALHHLIQDKLSLLYNQWRTDLTKALAHAEAIIDFGDDEDLSSSAAAETNSQKAQQSVWGNVQMNISSLKHAMRKHIQDNQRGEIIREGVKVAIIGPPNAGKSSLLNILAKRDAAIVSPIAGTTRDVVEVIMDLGGVRCIVSDTAGIRDTTEDIIEQEGIRRARVAAMDAHVCVVVVDATDNAGATVGSTLVDNIATSILSDDSIKIRPMTLLVFNKIDLITAKNNNNNSVGLGIDHLVVEGVTSRFGVSCTTGIGVDEFLNALTSVVVKRVSSSTLSEEDGDEAETVITRARHRYHVQEAIEALNRFELQSQQGLIAVDLASEELRLAASELGRVVGAVDVEDVLDVLFADFCIGK